MDPQVHTLSKYILLLLFGFHLCNPGNAQERKFIYDVVRNGKVIGEISWVELAQGQKKFLSMTSNVETTLIFTITDHTVETAAYDKGVMIYSSFYQKQTGSDEINRTTTISGKFYKVTDKGESKILRINPIRYNTLLLYMNIPKNINKVYSANFQKLVDIKKISENKYRLLLPDGKYNDYTYTNGICSKVEVVRSIGTVQFVLKQQK